MVSQEPSVAGFRELEHTADWELEVWAPSLTGLLEQAAHGMYALAGTILVDEPSTIRSLTIKATDPEDMLVSFLSELLFIGEDEGLGFDHYLFDLDRNTIRIEVKGKKIVSQEKEIKAVTFHNLSINKRQEGYHTRIVFDV